MVEPLQLGDGVLLRGGRPWTPAGPFHAVVGDPVAHSLSPAMQSAALAARGLDFSYVALQVAPGRLGELADAAGASLLAGFNVTAPHKLEAARLCAELTPEAAALGAVNAVRCRDGRWLGHNTDAGGLLAVLAEAWRGTAPERAVVLGSGGAARAAAAALVRFGAGEVEVRWHGESSGWEFGRWADEWSRERTAEGEEPPRITLAPLGEPPVAADASCVWISCLPAAVPCAPHLPDAAGGRPALLIDLNYAPRGERAPAPLGFRFLDGLPVLLMQGGLSFAWWFGPPVPWQAMREALALRSRTHMNNPG